MKRHRIVAVLTIGCLLAVAACGSSSSEEGSGGNYPNRSIELIVPFDAGGGTDQSARKLAAAAEEPCGANIVITNKSGGSGTVGLQSGLNAAADGYTAVLATSSTLLASHFGVSDVTPADMRAVMKFNFDPSVLSVAADSEYKSIDDFLSAAENGKRLLIGTSGSGSIWELSFAGMARTAGVPPMVNVPYDGASAAIVALLSGDIDATSVSGVEARAQIESGDLRPLATMSNKRLSFLPNVPTLKQSGVNWSSSVWRGLVVPKGTPDDVVNHLSECFTRAYRTKAFQDWMADQGYGLDYLSAEKFSAWLESDFEQSGKLVESLDLG